MPAVAEAHRGTPPHHRLQLKQRVPPFFHQRIEQNRTEPMVSFELASSLLGATPLADHRSGGKPSTAQVHLCSGRFPRMRASSGCRAAPFRIWTARLWPSQCWPVRDLITSHQRLACRPLALAAQSRTQPRAIASVHLDHGTKNGLAAWPSVCRSRFSPSILARFASGTRAGPNGDGGREARDSDSGGGEEGGVNKKPSNGRREALLTVPNVLTFARLAMTPLIGHLIVTQQWNNALGLV